MSRLVVVLLGFGASCGLTLAAVFDWTEPRIRDHHARLVESAVQEVLKGPARFTAYYVAGDTLSATPPVGVDPLKAEKIYLGWDAAGRPIGFAMEASGSGFLETIQLIFGYDPRTRRLTGMQMIDQRETPGIGDRIEKDMEFVEEFVGARTPLRGVNSAAQGGDPEAVDLITGATISSRAVLAIINRRLEAVEPVLEHWAREGGAG